MSWGDGVLGPIEISHRAPRNFDQGCPDRADAYVPHQDGCAARFEEPWWSSTPALALLHPIRAEPDFMNVFNALHRAVDLRSQVICDAHDCKPLDSVLKLPQPTNPIRKLLPKFWPPEVLIEPFTDTKFNPSTGGKGSLAAKRCSRVRFCDRVQVFLWGAESKSARSIEVASSLLSNLLYNPMCTIDDSEQGEARPQPFVHFRLSDDHKLVDDGLFPFPRGGGDDPHRDFLSQRLGSELPEFLHHLQASLRAREVHLQEGEYLRLRSWYLHRQEHRTCHFARTVELEGNPYTLDSRCPKCLARLHLSRSTL